VLNRDPFRRIDEIAARDAVGLEVFVFVDEVVRHLTEWSRDAVSPQVLEKSDSTGRHGRSESRDEIGYFDPSP
jgi:hypothetical protein